MAAPARVCERGETVRFGDGRRGGVGVGLAVVVVREVVEGLDCVGCVGVKRDTIVGSGI